MRRRPMIASAIETAAWAGLGGLVAVATALLTFGKLARNWVREAAGVREETRIQQPLVVTPAVEYADAGDVRELKDRVDKLGHDMHQQLTAMRADLDRDRKRSVDGLYNAQRQFAGDMAEALGAQGERIAKVEATQETHTRVLDRIDVKLTNLLERR